jgi:hypothetical protein
MSIIIISPLNIGIDNNENVYAASGTSQIVTVPTPKNVKVVKKSSTSLKISWSKVAGAKGYVVYQYNSKAKKYKAIKTLKGVSKTSWVNKKLKTNKTYKYKVTAYKQVSGKKKYSKLSYVVSARAYAKNAKTVNASKIVSAKYIGYTNRYLGLRAVFQLSVSAKVIEKNAKPVSKKIRWFSSNTKIVKVNSKGLIRAQGKVGACYVYARVHNGIAKRFKVIVKDYANPKSFKNLDKVKKYDKRVAALLADFKDDFCDIVSYLETLNRSAEIFYDKNAKHLQALGYDINLNDDLWYRLEKLFKDENITVDSNNGDIIFQFPNKLSTTTGDSMLLYSDYNGADNQKKGSIKIAPCWYYYYSVGGE